MEISEIYKEMAEQSTKHTEEFLISKIREMKDKAIAEGHDFLAGLLLNVLQAESPSEQLNMVNILRSNGYEISFESPKTDYQFNGESVKATMDYSKAKVRLTFTKILYEV
jgi:hypothetical protein